MKKLMKGLYVYMHCPRAKQIRFDKEVLGCRAIYITRLMEIAILLVFPFPDVDSFLRRTEGNMQ